MLCCNTEQVQLSTRDHPQLSVVMSTFNRGHLIGAAVQSVLAQQDPATPSFEVIVVDNNSTDDTRAVIERFADVDRRVRYVFEPQQGSSFGRNAGVREARAAVIAFTDDDVRADSHWLAAVMRAFSEHPDADVVGGRVLPLWPSPPPEWLTRDHWMPLALVDYGEAPVRIDLEKPLCLVCANCAFRRRALDRVGGFAPEFQLGGHRIIGSVEDHELQLRVLRTGGAIVYDPRIIVQAEVQPNRLERAYHRRWHAGHGHFHSLLRSDEMEHTRVGTLSGVPAHLYGQAIADLIGWTKATLIRDRERAFRHELQLRFFCGFFRTRRREFLRKPRRERWAELRRLLPKPRPTVAADTRVAGGK